MTRLDDETLMAYADGALDEATREAVERQIASDPDARRTVEMFRHTARIAREAFDGPMSSPPPKDLVDMINRHPAASMPARAAVTGSTVQKRDADGAVVAFQAGRRRKPGLVSNYALPLAASLALAIGIGTGYLIWREPAAYRQSSDLALGPVAPGSVLARLLESKRTGESIENAVVVATFRDRNDRVCREVEQRRGNSQVDVAGVACRQPGGGWIVEGAARIAAPVTLPGGGIVPSGTDEKDALASLLAMLGARPVLTPDEEKALLDRGWK